jgi:hypothetical protein
VAEQTNRTLVGSVLFIDIVGYSRRGVDEQVRLKRRFNAVLNDALDQVPAHDRIAVDTGDGAAIAFLENPEAALFAALVMLDHAGEVPVRMGINLGPLTLMQDINGRDNMVGDAINAAERVMSFAADGQRDPTADFRLKTRQRGRHFIGPDAEAERAVATCLVRDQCARRAGVHVFDRHRHARQNGASRVADRA